MNKTNTVSLSIILLTTLTTATQALHVSRALRTAQRLATIHTKTKAAQLAAVTHARHMSTTDADTTPLVDKSNKEMLEDKIYNQEMSLFLKKVRLSYMERGFNLFPFWSVALGSSYPLVLAYHLEITPLSLFTIPLIILGIDAAARIKNKIDITHAKNEILNEETTLSLQKKLLYTNTTDL